MAEFVTFQPDSGGCILSESPHAKAPGRDASGRFHSNKAQTQKLYFTCIWI
jgi:hypothetical protein